MPEFKILEIDIVKGSGRVWVHVDGYVGVHIFWTHLLELSCIRFVQTGVHWVPWAEAVNPIGKPVAMRESNGVRRCKNMMLAY